MRVYNVMFFPEPPFLLFTRFFSRLSLQLFPKALQIKKAILAGWLFEQVLEQQLITMKKSVIRDKAPQVLVNQGLWREDAVWHFHGFLGHF